MAQHRRRRPTRHERAEAGEYIPTTVPKTAAVVAVVVLILAGVAVTALDGKGDKGSRQLISLIVATVPGLLALAYSERASKDIRNGTVVAKTKEGAREAILEAGPEVVKSATTAAIHDEGVMTRNGPAITAELAALTELVLLGRENGEALQRMAREMPSRPTLTNPEPSGDEDRAT